MTVTWTVPNTVVNINSLNRLPRPAFVAPLIPRNQMPVAVRRAAVGVSRAELDNDQIQAAVPDAALGDNRLGEFTDPFHGPLQHDGLDALIVIEVSVQGRDRQIVVCMLNTRQPLREIPFVMIIDIGQIRDARAPHIALFGALLQVGTENIAHRLASVRVATLFDEFIERRGEVFIE